MNPNPATTRTCPSCHAALPPDAPDGLCPSCLLQTQTVASSAGSLPPPGPRPAAGRTFAGYRIERLLGRGGMGEVFEAEHLATGRRVALKVMNHGLSSDQDRKRFLREGRLAASVNHPNVVYIHGGEEVNGTPIIAMELVRDGTLKDRLRKQGPLPVAEAVSAILQVVAGLEAAHARGVLHRDIKPANCFVSADGTVKVGDFGLSVSTLARGESLLTATGAVLGTPAYASPEQLRGEELDVTSDIYSVGATLYHLLTGRTPFTATDFVKLITEVLDRVPAPPQSLRAEIPAELSAIVSRCLAKEPKARYRDYAQLRRALLPFSGVLPTRAPLGPRFLAGCIDDIVVLAPFAAYGIGATASPMERPAGGNWLEWIMWLLWIAGGPCYYAICEGLWGATFGKAVLGLKVVALDGGLPGLRKSSVRVAVVYLPAVAAYLLAKADLMTGPGSAWWQDLLGAGLFGLLFATVRARNGFAAVHDLASRTRVVLRPRLQPRPAVPPSPSSRRPSQVDGPLAAFGPYAVKGCWWQRGEESLLEAFDEALQRRVWIWLRPGLSVPIAPDRKDLSRSTRLRWLNGGALGERSWDAFDALEGTALVDLLGRPLLWESVRFWLLDLATEGQASLKEFPGRPDLHLNRVWITPTGRAVVLDFPAPAAAEDGARPARAHRRDRASDLVPGAATAALDGSDGVQSFLNSVARSALEGAVTSAAEVGELRAPVPLEARTFLASLARGTLSQLEYVVGNLESLVKREGAIARTRRALSVTTVPLMLALISLVMAVAVGLDNIRQRESWKLNFPGRPSFRLAADEYIQAMGSMNPTVGPGKDVQLARAYFLHHFSDLLTNEVIWTNTSFMGAAMTEMERDALKEIIRGSPPERALIEEAERVLPARLGQRETAGHFEPVAVFGFGFIAGQMFFAGLELLGLLWLGRSLTLHVFGICIVDREGRPAGRARLVWRWGLAWLPAGLAAAFGYWLCAAFLDDGLVRYLRTGEHATHLRIALTGLLACVLAIGTLTIVAIRRPECSLADRWAWTRLVLR